ncbi:MAG TPA: UPF0280 family protein [Deltaproteobacteria bacterium]|nr:UPF0280 family protein [Deltaproteobacteria bacterium]
MNHSRTYRNLINKEGLVSFRVAVKETDLLVQAVGGLEETTIELVLRYRGVIESYIQRYPEFRKTLTPWQIRGPAPLIIRDMATAGEAAGVGPMAAVAGAISAHVGADLLSYSSEVIVENGGDIFLKINDPGTVAIYAGPSPLSLKIGLKVYPDDKPMGVCTSSGTVGHSLSFGKADAVCVVSRDCALADAVATAVCNQVKSGKDIQKAIDFGKRIRGVNGLAIIIDEQIGMWGDMEIVPLG